LGRRRWNQARAIVATEQADPFGEGAVHFTTVSLGCNGAQAGDHPQAQKGMRVRAGDIEACFKEDGKMSNLVHNERVKMTANMFNNLAVVSLATGALTPIFSVFFIHPSATPVITESEKAYFAQLPINIFGLIAIAVISFAMFLSIAQFTLLGLKE
jgi:hypothetical protein